MTIELVTVDDAATRDAARDLIAEYLRWIAGVAAASYGLSFDIDAMEVAGGSQRCLARARCSLGMDGACLRLPPIACIAPSPR